MGVDEEVKKGILVSTKKDFSYKPFLSGSFYVHRKYID